MGMGMAIKKAGPPPGRRASGSIDVICGTNSGSRRSTGSKENTGVIQVNDIFVLLSDYYY